MKRFFILTMICCAAIMAQAQAYHHSSYYNRQSNRLDYGYNRGTAGSTAGKQYYGLRIGAAFSTVNSDDPTLDGGNSQTGLNVSAVTGLPLSNSVPLYLETGLSYVEKGGKKSIGGKKMTYDLNYLELPIVVKYAYNVDRHFSIQPFLGGYLACGVGGKIKNYGEREAQSSFSDDAFQRFDGGLRLGVGAAYDMFYFDISYDIGLSNICHDTFDTSHNGCLGLNVGVNF